MSRLTWQVYLPDSGAWVIVPIKGAIAWMHSGGLVRCSDG